MGRLAPSGANVTTGRYIHRGHAIKGIALTKPWAHCIVLWSQLYFLGATWRCVGHLIHDTPSAGTRAVHRRTSMTTG